MVTAVGDLFRQKTASDLNKTLWANSSYLQKETEATRFYHNNKSRKCYLMKMNVWNVDNKLGSH